MDAIFTLAQFTPAEAERVTGATTTMQRDWRRRGFLPSGDGHARFDLFSLGRLFVMKALADRGIGPSLTGLEAEWCALAVARDALRWRDGWDGDHESTLTWLPDFASPPPLDPAMVDLMTKINAEDPTIAVPETGSYWGAQAEYLTRHLWRRLSLPRVMPAPLFVWLADGSHIFTDSFDEWRSTTLTSDACLAGPLIAMDLTAMASVLQDRAGRPFVHVEFVPEGEGEPIDPNRLEHGAAVPVEPGNVK